jgi:hypothetical protein
MSAVGRIQEKHEMPQTRTSKKTTRSKTSTTSSAPRSGTTSRPRSKAATTSRNGHAHSVTEEQIRERAYHIFLSRNGAPGDPFSDWVQAERELKS